MADDNTESRDDGEQNDEFYAQATFQFSREPGRIERILVGLFDEDGEMEVRRATNDPIPEYYVPAMFQFSNDPGRIERFLQAVFEEEDEPTPSEVPPEFRDDFYLPAANPDGLRRPRKQQPGPMTSVSDESSEKD